MAESSSEEEDNLMTKLWNGCKIFMVLALYTPFIVSLVAGTLGGRNFGKYIQQGIEIFDQCPLTAEAAKGIGSIKEESKITQLCSIFTKILKRHKAYLRKFAIDPFHEYILYDDTLQYRDDTLQYRDFLRVVALGDIKGISGHPGKHKLAAYIMASLTPRMKVYAFLGKRLNTILVLNEGNRQAATLLSCHNKVTPSVGESVGDSPQRYCKMQGKRKKCELILSSGNEKDGKRFGVIVYHRRKKVEEFLLKKVNNNTKVLKKKKNKRKVQLVVPKVDQNEVECLHERVKSFISNMHLIQGDRKFSKWKGSVVDSVGGAYLTQNVTDILSSSAFMMLAAKYPCSTDTTKNTGSSSSSSADVEDDKPIENATKSEDNANEGEETLSRLPKKRVRVNKKKDKREKDWDHLKEIYDEDCDHIHTREKCTHDTSSAVDWDAVSMAHVEDIAKAIESRGMNNNLATRIKNCLTMLDKQLGSVDLEWMRNVPPLIAKEFLLSIRGLGMKSVECICLLTLQHKAFPIDTNAGRVAVRLGWVPLQPLPQGQVFHRLKVYPHVDIIQEYLWPRLSKLDQSVLYELHCHMITCGKVFCRKVDPNCSACPMKAECKYYASAQQQKHFEIDIEDHFRRYTKIRGVRVEKQQIKLKQNKKDVLGLEQGESLIRRVPKLKNIRTEHPVYEIHHECPLLKQLNLEKKEPSDPCHYLLAIWTQGNLDNEGCVVEQDIVSGTVMIPIRTAMRGTFPLNGTYFQSNEVLADVETSEVPIKVHRSTISHLPRTTLYCGSSTSAICRGMTSQNVKKCFSEGYVCFRAFDRKTREPKPLLPRFQLKQGKEMPD